MNNHIYTYYITFVNNLLFKNLIKKEEGFKSDDWRSTDNLEKAGYLLKRIDIQGSKLEIKVSYDDKADSLQPEGYAAQYYFETVTRAQRYIIKACLGNHAPVSDSFFSHYS